MTGVEFALWMGSAAVAGGLAGWVAGMLAAQAIRSRPRPAGGISERAYLAALARLEQRGAEAARRVGGQFDG